MEKQLFVNLPVKNLERSIEFFKKLGFTFNKQFTDNNGAMMIVNENSSVMLLTEEFFRSFTKKPIGDIKSSPQVIMAITEYNKTDVGNQAERVEAAGGRIIDRFTEPEGMYGIHFEDLDANLWEIFYMDMSVMK